MAMALTLRICKTQKAYLFLYIGNKLCCSHLNSKRCQSNSTMLEVDNLDSFTTQLMQKKLYNWEIMQCQRRLLKENVKFPEPTINIYEDKVDIDSLSVKQLDSILKEALDCYNICLMKNIINECLQFSKIPSIPVLLNILSVYSTEGEKNSIMSVIDLCKKCQPSILTANSDFYHYLAEATWVKGNVNEAVVMFEKVYRSNTHLRRRIRVMLKYLILTVIPNRGEAALITLLDFVERIAFDFNDLVPLMYLWQTCFISEWYSNQCLAFDLLQRHHGLHEIVSNKLIYVVALALRHHRVEVVQTLLEEYLKLQQNSACALILEGLFDYRVRQRDMRGCSEILRWSLRQQIDLPINQQQKFVSMFLSYNLGMHINLRKAKPNSGNTPSYKF